MRFLTEDRQLYKGIFWIVYDDVWNNSDYCFLIPTDRFGDAQTDLGLNAKSGSTFNHEKTWAILPKKMTGGYPYDYFPRGRVEINHGKATIYCNPNICTEELKQFIIREFNLTPSNGIDSVRLCADGSEHYKCYLDR